MNIALRRADGGEPIVLKKTEAQELGLITRTNTRKNKQGFVGVALRLAKLGMEAAALANQEDLTPSTMEPALSKKSVRWDETLAYYQENTETTMAYALAEAESLATPDELSVAISTPSSSKKKNPRESKDKNETPRVRRVRGLGAANGTPGKGLLNPASMLSDAIATEQDTTTTGTEKPLRLPKASKLKKLVIGPGSSSSPAPSSISTKVFPETKLPALEIAPVGISEAKNMTKERKSRLATPRRVKLPQPATAVPSLFVEGKENQQQSRIAGATPKKGIRLSEANVPTVVGESGLPRRRAGRK